MAIIQKLAHRRYLFQEISNIAVRSYTTPGPLSLGKKEKTEIVKKKDVELAVEKDAHKLVSFVCGTNLFEENGTDVAIKPDSEYPEWLWTLHAGAPLPLSKLDPNTLEYWERVRELGIERKKKMNLLYVQNRDHK